MNDTIMASVAALKSRNQATSYSLYTGFRSVRTHGELAPTPQTKANGMTTIALDVDSDILDHLRCEGSDHMDKIRAILRDYVASKA